MLLFYTSQFFFFFMVYKTYIVLSETALFLTVLMLNVEVSLLKHDVLVATVCFIKYFLCSLPVKLGNRENLVIT